MKNFRTLGAVTAAGTATVRHAFCIDESYSKLETDMQPNRLEVERNAVLEVLGVMAQTRPFDQACIVAFHGVARTLCPPVPIGPSLDLLRAAVMRLDCGNATNIHAGIAECDRHLTGRTPAKRWLQRAGDLVFGPPPPSAKEPAGAVLNHLLLSSDGDANCGPEPDGIADDLKARGVIISVIGISGGPGATYFDEARLKRLASKDPDGTLRYAHVLDVASMHSAYQRLGQCLRKI